LLTLQLFAHKSKNMNADPNLEVIELRNYLLKENSLDRFADYFEEHLTEPQEKSGGYILGRYRVEGIPNRFFWIRGFQNMHTRIQFLRAFYDEGTAWKEFGAGANEMILDSDRVHLLRPLNGITSFTEKSKGINIDISPGEGNVLVIDFFTAHDNSLDELINLCNKEYIPFLNSFNIDVTLWVTETRPSEFRHPVIQEKNLLVMIRTFNTEDDYQMKSAQMMEPLAEINTTLKKLTRSRDRLVLYSLSKSPAGKKN